MQRSKSFARFRVPPRHARRALSMVGLTPQHENQNQNSNQNQNQNHRLLRHQSSLGEASESLQETLAVTTFLTRLTALLFFFAARSITAWLMFIRLVLYATLLLPGFLRIVYRYITSNSIFREFYGDKRRQSLDIYVDFSVDSPYGQDSKRPVIIFLSGGAWIIGYKAWGAFMGFCYSRLGFVFVTPDYRNFPQVEVDEMINDVDLAIAWVKHNIRHYEGSDHIVLMGQSAGAHLGAMALLSAMRRNVERVPEPALWNVEDLSGFVGISGPYNISRIAPYLEHRGLSPALLNRLFKHRFKEYSPVYQAKDLTRSFPTRTVENPVPIVLFHGTNDVTVPHEISEEFYWTLKHCVENKGNVSLTLMDNLSHTDPIIELPMSGSDPLMANVVRHLNVMLHTSIKPPAFAKQLLPMPLIHLARVVNPF